MSLAAPPLTAARAGAARLRSTRRTLQSRLRRPIRVAAASSELCCIVDEDNNVVGAEPRDKTVRECVPADTRAPRSDTRAPRSADLPRRRLWGRGAYVLVFDAAGSLYVTTRSARKDVYPGLRDVVTSGVVSAGESYVDTATRELREELGFEGSEPEQLFAFRWVDASCRVWGAVFSARCDGPVRHADGEVAAGEWLPMREVTTRLAAEPGQFTPVGRYILAAYAAQQRARQRAVARPSTQRRCKDGSCA